MKHNKLTTKTPVKLSLVLLLNNFLSLLKLAMQNILIWKSPNTTGKNSN